MVFHNKNDEYTISDAYPDHKLFGARNEIDEAIRKWEVKKANEPPTWRWLTDEEIAADERKGK